MEESSTEGRATLKQSGNRRRPSSTSRARGDRSSSRTGATPVSATTRWLRSGRTFRQPRYSRYATTTRSSSGRSGCCGQARDRSGRTRSIWSPTSPVSRERRRPASWPPNVSIVSPLTSRTSCSTSTMARAAVVVSALYQPASEAMRVGGDWYLVTPLDDDGRVAVCVGDVVGHGLQAAIVMGRLRAATAVTALTASDPLSVVEHRGSLRIHASRCHVFDIGLRGDRHHRDTISYVCAGHPYPLLITPDGVVRYLEDGRVPPLSTGAPARRFPTGTGSVADRQPAHHVHRRPHRAPRRVHQPKASTVWPRPRRPAPTYRLTWCARRWWTSWRRRPATRTTWSSSRCVPRVRRTQASSPRCPRTWPNWLRCVAGSGTGWAAWASAYNARAQHRRSASARRSPTPSSTATGWTPRSRSPSRSSPTRQRSTQP